jgi:hypothetical protein
VLTVHVVVELLAGCILCFSPTIFAPTADDENAERLRNIGNGAVAIGLLGMGMLSLTPRSRPRVFYGVIAQYHVGVVWLQLRAPLISYVPWWLPPGFHSLLALFFIQAALVI